MSLAGEIQEALDDLVGAARKGLLALSVGLRWTVVHRLMDADVDEVVGREGKGGTRTGMAESATAMSGAR